MQKIAVLFGGKSNENEISILTGVFVLNLIDKEKFIPHGRRNVYLRENERFEFV